MSFVLKPGTVYRHEGQAGNHRPSFKSSPILIKMIKDQLKLTFPLKKHIINNTRKMLVTLGFKKMRISKGIL